MSQNTPSTLTARFAEAISNPNPSADDRLFVDVFHLLRARDAGLASVNDLRRLQREAEELVAKLKHDNEQLQRQLDAYRNAQLRRVNDQALERDLRDKAEQTLATAQADAERAVVDGIAQRVPALIALANCPMLAGHIGALRKRVLELYNSLDPVELGKFSAEAEAFRREVEAREAFDKLRREEAEALQKAEQALLRRKMTVKLLDLAKLGATIVILHQFEVDPYESRYNLTTHTIADLHKAVLLAQDAGDPISVSLADPSDQ